MAPQRAKVWLNQEILANMLELPVDVRIVGCQGILDPPGIEVVVEGPMFSPVPMNAEAPRLSLTARTRIDWTAVWKPER